ncbi:MAG: class I SAM-dependent methyltransferase [Eubacterium sp.]|nr:class I SAM-dependent methyltransferase [Eubacterium sp.]
MIEQEQKLKDAVTEAGNPAKPEGQAGVEMLARMNEEHAAVTDWALSLWQIDKDDIILDVGCGAGGALKKMSKAMGDDGFGELAGVDYSPVSVAEASRTNAEDIESSKIEILEGSVDALPFAGERFDKVITIESFYFWPDPDRDLKEVLRVMKKDGRFFLVADIYGNADLSEHEKENIAHYNLFNPTDKEFEQMFRKAGFADVIIHKKEGTNWICVEGIA